MTDGQLLTHYRDGRDTSLFREVITRHGPAVLRVCRFVLRDLHEAEDAFQATFLVFIRRAPAIRDPEALGRWLCGVAYRVASRSRSRLTKQRERELKRSEMLSTRAADDNLCPELRRIVRDELDRLPENFLAPILLCYFHGLTHEEAAKHLGWPVGTVKVRLVRARNLLRDRLDRRGVSLSLVFFLFRGKTSAEASIPESLIASSVETMNRMSSRVGATKDSRSPFPVQRTHPESASSAWIAGPVSCIFAGILAVILGISGHVAIVSQLPPPARNASFLPANLTNVLEIDCH